MIAHWIVLADPRIVPTKGGHINTSYFIADGVEAPRWLLQRLNRDVFPSPEKVMHNIGLVLAGSATVPEPGIGLPNLLRTPEGAALVRDAEGESWRCWEMMPNARSGTTVTCAPEAWEAARAFGAFARFAATLEASQLAETIPGFHDTPVRLARLETSIARDVSGRVARAREEIALALRYRALAPILIAPLQAGVIPTRVAHNDAKVANVLFDLTTGRAAMVIDLDTVMPGTPLFDFGDLVRSSVSTAAEDTTALDEVVAEPPLYQALLEGYLAGTGRLLTPGEIELMEPAGRVITWEQAIRFLTDYLDGDTYFATEHPGHNLERTRAQLALLASLERQKHAFRAMVT